jgi:hypothetical protein
LDKTTLELYCTTVGAGFSVGYEFPVDLPRQLIQAGVTAAAWGKFVPACNQDLNEWRGSQWMYMCSIVPCCPVALILMAVTGLVGFWFTIAIPPMLVFSYLKSQLVLKMDANLQNLQKSCSVDLQARFEMPMNRHSAPKIIFWATGSPPPNEKMFLAKQAVSLLFVFVLSSGFVWSQSNSMCSGDSGPDSDCCTCTAVRTPDCPHPTHKNGGEAFLNCGWARACNQSTVKDLCGSVGGWTYRAGDRTRSTGPNNEWQCLPDNGMCETGRDQNSYKVQRR